MNQLCRSEQGFSLLEVMVAMVVMAFSMLGVLGMFQWGDHGLRHGAMGTHALAMAQSRIEAKRTVSWESLLTDDLNLDGIPDVVMRDDGLQEDMTAGDGIYTGSMEQDGIRLVWTVQSERADSFVTAGAVVIQVRASYQVGSGAWRHVKIGTLRANPKYVGFR